MAMVAVGLSVHHAWAETITFQFTGTVTTVNPDTIGVIGGTDVVDVGDTLTGRFTYDLTTPGTTGGTGEGGVVTRTDYASTVPPGHLTYTVGGLTVTVEPGSEFFVVLVGNGVLADGGERTVDTFIVGAASARPTTLASVLVLEDTTQSVFSDTTLPTSLTLAAFDRRRFEVYQIIDNLSRPLFDARIDTLAVLATTVAIDIKPGNAQNRVDLQSNDVIPVAILTTETFDATTVDPLSVRFGTGGATEAHGKGHIEDVNKDGDRDLLLHFSTQATGIQCGDTSASLTGGTFDGDLIQGSDSIKTVGCNK
jgi:hypothetical protein